MYGFWIDESIKEVAHPSQKPIIAVGGYYMPIDVALFCISKWRELKQLFNIDEHSEVKWNIPEDHPTRQEISSKNINYWKFRHEALKLLDSWQFLTCVVSVLKDKRDRRLWHTREYRASCFDFYTESLKYSLQRVAEDSYTNNWGHCIVACDRFNIGKRKYESGAIRKGPNIVQDYYHRLYRFGTGGGPYTHDRNHILKDLNFHPSIMMSDASHDELIQIADFIVGCTSDWIFDTLYGSQPPFSKECMKILSNRFRNTPQTPQGFFGDGLNIFPFEVIEWQQLRSSLM